MTLPKGALEAYRADHGIYERHAERRLPKSGIAALRLDGRSFHTVTAGMGKPFDPQFERAMRDVAVALMNEIPDLVYAYIQSDEITVVFHHRSDWFDRRHEKIVSVAASLAASVAAKGYIAEMCPDVHAAFDCRALEMPGWDWALAMLAERQLDCAKNCVSATLYWALRHSGLTARAAHKRMQAIGGMAARRAALAAVGKDVDDASEHMRGTEVYREVYCKQGYNPIAGQVVTVERRRIAFGPAPDFGRVPVDDVFEPRRVSVNPAKVGDPSLIFQAARP